MAKIKLKAVLTATLVYEVEEGRIDSVSEQCRRDEETMREDPTDFCDSGRVRFTSKVTVVRDGKT